MRFYSVINNSPTKLFPRSPISRNRVAQMSRILNRLEFFFHADTEDTTESTEADLLTVDKSRSAVPG